MLLSSHVDYLSSPHAYWIATVSPLNKPDIVRPTGIVAHPESDTITIMFPEKVAQQTLRNLQASNAITLLACTLLSFESYQFKGVVISESRPCTGEEIEFQESYLDAFSDDLQAFGHDKQGFYNAYFRQPSLAFDFLVQEIFEQTPKKGTGTLLTSIANSI